MEIFHFSILMGNKLRPGYQVIPNNIQLGTLQECVNKNGGIIEKLSGTGDTVSEAIAALTEECRRKLHPLPQQVPWSEDEWYCGTFDVPPFLPFWSGPTTKYNTVWFTIKNKKVVAKVLF